MFVFLLSCIFSIGGALSLSPEYYKEEDAYQHFINFQQNYNRSYNNMDEQIKAFQTFRNNLQTINRLNKESPHAVFGITQFTDLTNEEIEKQYKGLRTDKLHDSYCPELNDNQIPDSNAPSAWDWRTQNAVTSARNQALCGSCWAFSAVGCLESQYAIKYGKQVDLSEQQLVDCDTSSHGCQGGVMTFAFRSVMKDGGIAAESDYQYVAQQGTCRVNGLRKVLKVNSCNSYNLQSQEKLKQLLHAKGPLSIGIMASADSFRSYKGGIITDEQCHQDQIDHGVLLVGYGDENGKPYWIVKNSWGGEWGEQGFFRMQRGNGAESCGMMNPYMGSADIA